MILRRFSVNRNWSLLFCLWFLFLTGGFARFIGSPGIMQALRLNALLQSKQSQLNALRGEVQKLQIEADLLENNPSFQLREIRRVLGYASHDEIIFDFSRTE